MAFATLLILAFSGYRGDAPWLPWLLWGGLVVSVSGLVSFFRTGLRVRRMEEKAGVASRASPLLAAVLWLLAFVQVPYLQWHLNSVWDAEEETPDSRDPGPVREPDS